MNAERLDRPVAWDEILRVFARIAALSFGGPAGQIAVMHRIIVEEKRWLSEERFLHAMNFCMLLPGPEAQQLATYSGWLLRGWRGGLLAGTLFVLPGFAAILVLSVLYIYLREFTLVAGLFFGLKAAVIAIVAQAVLRIGRRALRTRFLYAMAAGSFALMALFQVPFPLVIALAALCGLVSFRLRPELPGGGSAVGAGAEITDETGPAFSPESLRPPAPGRLARTALVWGAIWWSVPLLLYCTLGSGHVLFAQSIFFSKTALLTFGGAYSVLAYIADQAVTVQGWLKPGEMLDGLGLAETTPGPLIQVVQFVAFLGAYRFPGSLDPMIAALLGSLITTHVTYAPCFLWIFAGAPYMERLRRNRVLSAGLAAITAAVAGVILNLALFFALHTLFGETRFLRIFPFQFNVPVWSTFDPAAAILVALGLVLTFRFKLGLFKTLGLTVGAGFVLRLALAII